MPKANTHCASLDEIASTVLRPPAPRRLPWSRSMPVTSLRTVARSGGSQAR
jgi:hypothetical protein